jgi:hypothetical protein
VLFIASWIGFFPSVFLKKVYQIKDILPEIQEIQYIVREPLIKGETILQSSYTPTINDKEYPGKTIKKWWISLESIAPEVTMLVFNRDYYSRFLPLKPSKYILNQLKGGETEYESYRKFFLEISTKTNFVDKYGRKWHKLSNPKLVKNEVWVLYKK